MQPQDSTPTYSELGIDKTSTARPRGQALQIGEATIRLKWHKGRILGEMEKSEGGRPETGNTVLPVNDTPTYADLGINGNTMLPFG